MSHLARELDRQLVWIEKQALELLHAVGQLVDEGNGLMNSDKLWDDEQAEAIRQAIHEWAEPCGRSIASAHVEVTEFRKQLARADQLGTGDDSA